MARILRNRLLSAAIFVSLIVVSIAFAMQVSFAQDTIIFGYPYDTNGLSGSGETYSFWGARFMLNGSATITSISCKLAISYNWVQPNEISHYRFAVYSDDNGSVGSLIAQTEIGSGNVPVNGPANDTWRTLSLPSPVSLNPGAYWLIAVGDSLQVAIHDEPMTTELHAIVLGGLTSLDFPATLNKTADMAPTMYSIYASGQGVTSVMPRPMPSSSNPGVSVLLVSCQNIDPVSGEVKIMGNLSAYGASIPSANIVLFYKGSGDFEWQQLATVITDSNGSFTADWLPPAPGNYVINATYWGSSMYSLVFTAVNVLVTPSTGNQTQNVFSVESNSTVTALAFNSESQQLSLSVTGESGTIGYVDVYIAKNLIVNVSAVQAYIDGNAISYTVSSNGDLWVLHLSYHHSSHNIMFNLKGAETVSVPEMPQATLPLVIVALFVITVVAVTVQRRHR
jgi:hypothetical protein